MTWKICDWHDDSYTPITDGTQDEDCHIALVTTQFHAKRLVVCVNALAGIPSRELDLLEHLSEGTRLMALVGILNRKLGGLVP